MTKERIEAIHELARALMNTRPDLEQQMSLDDWLMENNDHLSDNEIIIGNEILEMLFDG